MAGAMIIDLQKSALKRAGKKIAAALSWQGWNDTPMGDMHPKGPDGRWVDDHPSVGVFAGAHEHLHELSDKDLAEVDRHVGALTTKLTEEIGRRKIHANAAERAEALRRPAPSERPMREQIAAAQAAVANPAKPLRAAARKPKVDLDSVRGEWDAAVARPMPSDRARFKDKLSGLTLKQLEELNGGKLSGNNKDEKINHLIEHRIGYQLNSEAIRHGHYGGNAPYRTDRDIQLERINTEMYAADERGDRTEYGRLHQGRVDLDRDLEREAGPREGGIIPAEDRVTLGGISQRVMANEPSTLEIMGRAGRPASTDRPIRQSGTREGGVIPAGVSMTGRGEVTPQSMANARAERTAQARVDKIREKLAAARSKSRDEGLRLQSDEEVALRNELRKAEDQLREAKRKASTLPDTRGNAGPSDAAPTKRSRGIGPTDEEIKRLSDIFSRARGQGGGSESAVAAALSRENLSASELRDMVTWVHGSKPPPTVRSKAALQLHLAQLLAQQHRRTGNY